MFENKVNLFQRFKNAYLDNVVWYSRLIFRRKVGKPIKLK
jgi:hypothetical protein